MNSDERLTTFFPQPEPDETVYSLFARFHVISGHRNLRTSIAEFTEMADCQIDAEFPCFLKQLSQKSTIPFIHLRDEMTSLRYYQPFISETIYKDLLVKLRSGNPSFIQSQIGALANRMVPGNMLKYCPLCTIEDIEKLGYPTWKVKHQLAGCVACIIHGCWLKSTRKKRKNIILPSQSKPIDATSKALSLSGIVCDEYDCRCGELNALRLRDTYKRQLQECGYVTPEGRFRQKSLAIDLIEYLDGLENDIHYRSIITYLQKGQYPACLFYHTEALHHPLKHLVLINYLNHSWDKFLFRFNTFNFECIERKIIKKATPKMDNVNINNAAYLLKQGQSMRAVAEITNFSVGKIRTIAAQQRIEVNVRPQKVYKDIEREIWRKLFIGDSTQEIAKRFRLSVGAIEIILKKHPYLIRLRKNIRFFNRRKQYRSELATILVNKCVTKRNTVIKMCSRVYIWLYKHDKQWLYEQLPPAIPPAYRYIKTNVKK